MMTRKSEQVRSALQPAVLWLFLAVFCCIFVQIAFFNSAFGYSFLLQGVLLLLWLAVVFLVGAAGWRHKEFLRKHRYRVLAAALLLVLAVQLWVGVVTRQSVNHDYGKVFNGAVIFANQGDSEAFLPYKNYYHRFTNNVGEFLLLQLLFRGMGALSLTCFYEAAVVLGHLLFSVAILFTFLYLNRAFGTGAALASLLLFLCYLPVYFQSSIAYTDTYTIWTAPLALYLCERAKTAKTWPRRLGCFAGIGVALAVGAQLKATVLIVGVALVVETLLAGNWKRLVAMLAAAVLVFAALTGLFQRYAYQVVLNREQAERDAMPLSFWVMMGTIGDGAYNPTDEWVIASSVGGQKARNEVNLRTIRDRLKEMGVGGCIRLLHRKTSRSFGSGNGEVYYLLVREPDNPAHFIYQVLSTEGRFFRYFDNLSQAVYLSFYLFGAAGAAFALKRKNRAFLAHTAPFLACAGFYFFMLLWESNHRQLVNQWPLFIMVAAAGLALVLQAAQARLGRLRAQKPPADPEAAGAPAGANHPEEKTN